MLLAGLWFSAASARAEEVTEAWRSPFGTARSVSVNPADGSCWSAALAWDPRWYASTELISLPLPGSDGWPGASECPVVSADGRFVAFHSAASDLVPLDTNAALDVFVRDRLLGTTERVSVSSSGEEANGDSGYPSISADGRFVAYWSNAPNLVDGDTNNAWDAFVRDRLHGTTERVSVNSAGQQANGPSSIPVITPDGRFVAFASDASNLAPEDQEGNEDVFLRDRLAGTTELVSALPGDAGYRSPSISSDGRFVAFEGARYMNTSVWLRDRLSPTPEAVAGSSGRPSVSGDGRFVAFYSAASDLVPGDTNKTYDVFVRDRLLAITERVSIGNSGEQADSASTGGRITPDGRFVVFVSLASNLVLGDTNKVWDTFVRDRLLGITERASISTTGEQGNGPSVQAFDPPSITPDGRFVAFASEATNLVSGDTNGCSDIFLRDRGLQLFRDVPSDHWAFAEIMACVEAGLVSGYPDGTYQPTLPVTRDQMAVFVSRALAGGDANIPPGPATPSFADVPTTHWAYRYIEYAKAQRVAEGNWRGLYEPDRPVDRAQMAVFLTRALVAPWGDGGLVGYVPPFRPTFRDVSPTAWAYKHIEYLAAPARAVIHGYPDGLYHPELTVTRDQMAVYISRAFDLPM